MPVKQRQQWDAADIAAHAMEATSLSQLTPPEVKRMAARILAEQNGGDPASGMDEALVRAMRDGSAKV